MSFTTEPVMPPPLRGSGGVGEKSAVKAWASAHYARAHSFPSLRHSSFVGAHFHECLFLSAGGDVPLFSAFVRRDTLYPLPSREGRGGGGVPGRAGG